MIELNPIELVLGLLVVAIALAYVARRIGEKNPVAAAKAGAQSLTIALSINLVISLLGVIFLVILVAPALLRVIAGST